MGSSLFLVIPDQSDRCHGFVTELILRCARGEEDALGRLYDLFVPLFLSVIADGPTSRATDAAVIEAFRRLWQDAPTYDPMSRDAVSWILDRAHSVQGEHLVAG